MVVNSGIERHSSIAVPKPPLPLVKNDYDALALIGGGYPSARVEKLIEARSVTSRTTRPTVGDTLRIRQDSPRHIGH